MGGICLNRNQIGQLVHSTRNALPMRDYITEQVIGEDPGGEGGEGWGMRAINPTEWPRECYTADRGQRSSRLVSTVSRGIAAQCQLGLSLKGWQVF